MKSKQRQVLVMRLKKTGRLMERASKQLSVLEAQRIFVDFDTNETLDAADIKHLQDLFNALNRLYADTVHELMPR